MYCVKVRATPFYRPFNNIAIAELSLSQEVLVIDWICIARNSVAEICFLAMHRFRGNVYRNRANYCVKIRATTFFLANLDS